MFDYYKFYEVENLLSQGRIKEVQQNLKNLKQEFLNLQDEVGKLRNQNHYLEELLFISRNLIFDGDAYWLISEGQKQGPFCPNCYHQNGSLIRLRVENESDYKFNHRELWHCDHCSLVVSPEVEQEKKSVKESAKVIPFIQ